MTEIGQRTTLVLGEALMDVVVRGDDVVEHPGGSPMNVSLGVARLGFPVQFVTGLGDDDYGRAISDHVEASGVTLIPGREPGRRTSSARVTLNEAGAPEYLFDVDWSPAVPAADAFTVSHVHTGSIGAFLSPGAAAVESLVRQLAPRATVSFDPNIRAQFLPDHAAALALVERYVSMSDVVKASDEDVEWLYPGAELAEVAAAWRALGAAIVVITRGGEGAHVTTAAGVESRPGLVVEVVDSIGAGDAFMAGLIGGLQRRSLTGPLGRERLAQLDATTAGELIDLAMTCGAMTVARAGAQPPTAAELPSGLL
jgi:fructokinase